MNASYDYNGHVVAPSKPTKVLRTVKKTIMVDSADRDLVKYSLNGDWIIYLPRVYKNVISIRLASATFPQLIKNSDDGIPGAFIRNYDDNSDSVIPEGTMPKYFLVDIEGLNKGDECAVGGNKSTYPDGYFAIIPTLVSPAGNGTFGSGALLPPGLIHYNDKTYQDNISKYNPPIENLDRMHIRTRLHSQQGNTGFIYWTNDGAAAVSPTNTTGICDYQLTFEIEYLENGFDDFSSFETRLGPRN
jgi:hypothetical protein